MDENKTLIEKMTPNIVKYPAFFLGVVVDIISIIKLVQELTKDIPSKTTIAVATIILIVTIFLSIGYFIIRAIQRRTLALNNLNQLMGIIHEINHEIRNELQFIKNDDLIEIQNMESIKKNVKHSIENILNKLVKFFAISMNQRISVCLKDFVILNNNEIKEQKLNNFARSDNTNNSRKKLRSHILIKDNTDFDNIYCTDNDSGVFCCGDLMEKYRKNEYKNSTNNWSFYYNSTICVPIRFEINTNSETQIAYDIIGFLCIDSKMKNLEWEDVDHFAISTLCAVADALYPYLKSFKKLQMRKSDGGNEL